MVLFIKRVRLKGGDLSGNYNEFSFGWVLDF